MKVGIKGHSELTVTEDLLASSAGSGLVAVYATPMMIAAMEGTAAASVSSRLASGQTTVGIRVNVSHEAATPPGMRVHIESELVDIASNGKILTFRVNAYDEAGLIGTGTHERAVVDKAKFESKVQAKLAQIPK